MKNFFRIIAAFLSSFAFLFINVSFVSAANIKSVIGGTGIATQGIEDVTVSIAQAFRLPQGCATSQITAWDGSKWICTNNNGLTLPYLTSGSWDEHTLFLANTGLGRVGEFIIDNPSNTNDVVNLLTNGSGSAISANTTGDGYAIEASSNGNGFTTLSSINFGTGTAGTFSIENPESDNDALQIKADHKGNGLASHMTGDGIAGAFIIEKPKSTNTALFAVNHGNGDTLSSVTFGTGWLGNFYTETGRGFYVSVPHGQQGLNLVGGTGNSIVGTSSGARRLYTEESAKVWFTDYGFGQLTNGATTIFIDSVFADTVNLNNPYHVFVQPYGDANLYVTNRTATSFEVHSSQSGANTEFSYRIVAPRRGYETTRLENAPWANGDANL